MATLSDIDAVKQEAVVAIDTVLVRATAFSADPRVASAIEALRAKKTEIEDLTVPEAADEARFDWTLQTLRTAVDGMNAVGARMLTSNRIVNDLDTFLGGGISIVGAVRLMAAPRYYCPATGCAKSSTTQSSCPLHNVAMKPRSAIP